MIGMILGVAVGALALTDGPTGSVGWRIGETPEATALVDLTGSANSQMSEAASQLEGIRRDAVQPYSVQVAQGTGERLAPGDNRELVQRVWASLLVSTGR